MELPPINIQDYFYSLPDERIAAYPLPERDKARLLVYSSGEIHHHQFSELSDLLPHNSVLFFNDTKVIPARFIFQKNTGAAIEVFLLQPILPSTLLSVAMATTDKTTWKCVVGNLKRWTEGLIIQKSADNVILSARIVDRQTGEIEFSWTPSYLAFAEILQKMGAVPLPPYIKRKAETSDRERYQTVYSRSEGAVAAPTAGLHFTDSVFERLRSKKIIIDFVTLHVSAGTFLPVKTKNAVEHTMHQEQIIIHRSNLENLLLPGKQRVAVGTTALRTLESIYWYGALLLKEPDRPFVIDKLLPYQFGDDLPSTEEAITSVLNSLDRLGIEEAVGHTSIYIFPGYRFRVCQGLITNFHQPGSTLLMLIGAFVGPEWKKIYSTAIDQQYRFLSYGDSSLLLPANRLIL